MTPYEIKLLLDIYATPNATEGRHELILNETLYKLARLNLISGSMSSPKITSRGKAHISQLCQLPYPEEMKQWVDFAGNHIPIIN